MPDRRPNTLENIAGEPSQPDASLAQSVCA
jgi:hypothetical protein